jgi:hypothetical protein
MHERVEKFKDNGDGTYSMDGSMDEGDEKL